MHIFQQVLFVAVFGVAAWFLYRRIQIIRRSIMLGKRLTIAPEEKGARLRNMLLVAFGQRKMFKKIIPAVLHFFVYGGFLIINLEVLEFVVDGLLGTHRIFAPFLGSFYNIAMNGFEFLALAVMLSCMIFLIRRNILRIPRFWSAEMTVTAWPKLDANLILVTEIVLMAAIFTMNASDQLLQTRLPESYPSTGGLLISSSLISLFDTFSTGTLEFIERFAWWFHIIGILGFAVYVTYSKHLHIFMAFPNTYYARVDVKGKMTNMPIITAEVKSMLGLGEPPAVDGGEPGRFGAKDINDLMRNDLMAAFACTECGRCTAQCPANLTGKKLSPRKIMMSTRDRMEEVSKGLINGGKGLEDGKFLLGDYITKEEINACTSCNACVEACPVMINPLSIILELRRYVAMEESGSPASWNAMFQNVETNFAPWKFSPSDRFNWVDEA